MDGSIKFSGIISDKQNIVKNLSKDASKKNASTALMVFSVQFPYLFLVNGKNIIRKLIIFLSK